MAPNFTANSSPGFAGTGDTEDDISVVRIRESVASEWSIIGSDTNAFIRLTVTNPLAGTSFTSHGYGADNHDNTGRDWGRISMGTEGVSWSTAEYWLAYATQGLGHPCAGDSGSNAVNWDRIGIGMAIGIFSNYDQAASNACPQIGAKFRYTKVNDKMQYIETFAGSCTLFTANGWHYKRCF